MEDRTKNSLPSEELDEHGLLKLHVINHRYQPIAIIGIGLRMPEADTLAEFENVLLNRKSAIQQVPEDRWRHDDFYHPAPNTKGHYVIPKMGFCERYYHFDPGYFNMSPRETLFTDPQQRQVLQVTAQALQDAGYTADTIDKDTGVYIGMGIIDFPGALVENRFLYNGHTLTGFSHSCAANRVSHFYGLRGPSIAVDTACAASLTALHVACMSIWNGENRVAIAGATSNLYSPETTIAFSHLGVLSPSGKSAPFDITNDGYVRAEGTGIVVLKYLADALRDGDHVYNVIRATTSAHNGNSNSLTLPSAEAQEELIRRCYEQFEIPMGKVSFVEAHGTGTPVGDPLETKALGNTLGAAHVEPLPIQSAKSNFGHLEVAAGMVQVVKAALMLEKRMFYPQINWTSPNSDINLDELNLKIQLDSEKYNRQEKFLIGINTFGFGGSLVHMVFEEYCLKQNNSDAADEVSSWKFGTSHQEGRLLAIPFSAKTKTALRNTLEKWLGWSSEQDAQSIIGWLATRREHYRENRLVILANSGVSLHTSIHNYLNGTESINIIQGRKPPSYEKPHVCFLFPEDDAGFFSNFKSLYENSKTFRESVHRFDSEFQDCHGYSAISSYLTPETEEQNSEEQPPHYMPHFQIGLAGLFASWGIQADFYIAQGMATNIANYLYEHPCPRNFTWSVKDNNKTLSMNIVSGETLVCTNLKQKNDPHLIMSEDNSPNVDRSLKSTIKCILGDHPSTIFIELSAMPRVHHSIKTLAPKNTVYTLDSQQRDGWSSVLEMMGRLHVSGFPVDWDAVTNHSAQYAPIPLYGWDERVYRLESDEYYARRLGLHERTYRKCHGRINFEFFPYLNDYTIYEQHVFPAAAFIEYFAEYSGSTTMLMKNVTIHTNTELPMFTADGHIQTLVLKIRKDSTKLLAVTETDEIQAEGDVCLQESSCANALILHEEILSRCSVKKDKKEVYGKLSQMGFEYGWFFQLLSYMKIGDREAISKCTGLNMQLRHESIGTPLIDSAFQTALVAFTRGSVLYVPKYIDQVKVYDNRILCGTPFFVHTTLVEYSLKHIVCDISVASEDGHVYLTIEGFEAENQDIFDSMINPNDICYSEVWQLAEGASIDVREMKALTSIANSKENIKKLGMIGRLVQAMSRDIQQDSEDSAVPENLLELANLFDNTSSDCITQETMFDLPDLLPEVKILENLTAAIKQSYYDGTARQIIQHFFRHSSLIDESLQPVKSLINFYVKESLKHKDTITICEVGDGIGILTTDIHELLKDLILDGKVEYVCLRRRDSNIQQFVGNEPAVKIVDYDDGYQFTPQFDLIVIIDTAGKCSCPLTGIYKLLLDNGQMIGVQPQPSQELFGFFFPKKRDPQHLCTVLKDTNFIDIDHTTQCSDEFWVTIFARKKTPSVLDEGIYSPLVLTHINAYDIMEGIMSNMTSKVLVYDMEDVQRESGPTDQTLDVLCIMKQIPGIIDKMQKLMSAMHDMAKINKICCVFMNSEKHQISDARLSMEILRSQFPDSTVTFIDGSGMPSDQLASMVLDVIRSQSQPERLLLKNSSNCKVPRIMRLTFPEARGYDNNKIGSATDDSTSWKISVQSSGCHVVIDGGQCLGLEIARWLSETGAQKIFLLTASSSDCFITSTVKYMTSKGTDVRVIYSSLSTMAEDFTKFLQANESLVIKGLFFINETLHSQTETNRDVAHAQYIIDYVKKLNDTLKGHHLDYFVLFSSLESFLMSGQNWYASAAGAAFDDICLYRRTLNLKSLSVHLGRIRGSGIKVKNGQDRDGNLSLHIHEYLAILGNILQRDEYPPVIAIANQDWAKTYDSNSRSRRLFQHLVPGSSGQTRTESTDATDIEERCKDYLAALTGTPKDLIDTSHPVMEYGVDSLMSHDIVTWAQRTLEVTVTQTDVFTGLSLGQLIKKSVQGVV